MSTGEGGGRHMALGGTGNGFRAVITSKPFPKSSTRPLASSFHSSCCPVSSLAFHPTTQTTMKHFNPPQALV